jgi:iron complex outermembrane receptor protein
MYAPNTFFSELTARKISNATFRGIGSSPANAGVTTFIDGVPQLNTNSSSLGLSDVNQIEFVRGSQSALFGRNTLGGVVNITSLRPRLGNWGGAVRLPFGTENSRGLQGHFSGPIRSDRLGLGVAFDYGQRDGYTTNTITGSDLDRRESFSGKAQLLWTPSAMWETRLIVAGERDRDGDYALSDLAGLRQQPFEVARDFEGRTDRDVMSTTFLVRRQGARVAFSSVTGLVRWRAQDLTDLDYSPAPLIRRDNLEKDVQFTQELRWASAPGAAVRLSDATSLRWQSGLFLFTQNYTQDAVNSYAPFSFHPRFLPLVACPRRRSTTSG